jgi:hypothetical protein
MGRASRSRARGRRNARSVGGRRPRKTLLVFCEGKSTEPEYLSALKQEPSIREAASVKIQWRKQTIGITPPLLLVQEAAKERNRASAVSAEIDEVWCVFDVEWPRNHPNLHQALALAQSNDIKVAVSNPCFELWLALHFRPCAGLLTTSEAEKLRQQLDGRSGKGVDGEIYMPLREEASGRARRLDAEHRRNGKAFPKDNPSSGMYKLLDALVTID